MNDILVIGSLNMDFVVEVPKSPLPGETIIANKFSLVPGGKGANQAFALGRLGARVSMIGAVGNDEYGKKLIDNLKLAHVNTKKIFKMNDVNTGNAFINVDKSGENSIVVVSGANEKITKEFIDNNICYIKRAKIIVMQLEIPIEVVTYVAKIAKELGKIVVVDPAPARCDLPDELFSNVDIMKPNETELQTLSGINLNNEEDILKGAKILLNKGVKNVIVTLGANGSMLVNANGYKKFDALKVDVVDTTAAGDSFTAGLVNSLVLGKSLEDAIKYGHIVSSIVVTRKGAQSSIPTKMEVSKYIKEVGLVNE